MHNVQLTHRERTQVYIEIDTNRILGFAPENARPMLPKDVRYKTHVCYFASEIEKYAARYREQCLRDAEESTMRKLESERPFRNALRQAVIDRSNNLDPWNRDVNMALLKVMDHFYERALNARMSVEACIAAEKYEESKKSTDIAMESYAIKKGELHHA